MPVPLNTATHVELLVAVQLQVTPAALPGSIKNSSVAPAAATGWTVGKSLNRQEADGGAGLGAGVGPGAGAGVGVGEGLEVAPS